MPLDSSGARLAPIDQIPILVKELYGLVGKLEKLFDHERRFTLDGHLVGSIGEVLAAHRYGLTLLPHSHRGHDARAPSGVLVEIKATQGSMVAMRDEPEHLLVLLLSKEGTADEIYNGPGALAWAAAGAMQRNGQRPISLFRLRRLMADIHPSDRLPILRA